MKLVSREERGQPGWKLPGDTESNEIDSGVLATLVPYENVTLAMYGKKIALTDKICLQSFRGTIRSANAK
jgi:hypothetical protein